VLLRAHAAVPRAAADENPDLFWAIRGGGGNFGIAASLEYALHPVGPMIAGGLVAHPLQNARDVLRFFRETCASLPDEMMMAAGLLTAPDGSGHKLVGMLAAHCGSLADGEAAVKPIKAFGPPVMDAMGPISYCQQNGLLDPSLPKGALNYWKSHFLTDLSDDCIATLVDAFAGCPSPMSQIVIEHFHGAASRVRSRIRRALCASPASTSSSSRNGRIRATPIVRSGGAATCTRRSRRISARRGT
jgi:hypothetical protein